VQSEKGLQGSQVTSIGLAFASVIAVAPTVAGATMVNLGITAIVDDWGVSQQSAQWVSSAYMAALAIGLPVSDWITKRFGLRRTVVTFLVLYFACSIWAAAASGLTSLVVARIFQGLFAGIIQPATLAALYLGFPIQRRGMAVGLFSFATAAAAGIAPWIGGMLVDISDWRSMFFALAIPAAVAIPLVIIYYPSPNSDEPKTSLDWLGLGLLAMSIGLVFIGLHRFAMGDGSIFSQLVLAIAVMAGLYLFWRREISVKDPLIDMRALAKTRMACTCSINFLLGTGLYGSSFVIPLYAQEILGMTANDAGLLLLPGAIFLSIGTLISGKLLNRVSLSVMMSIGIAVFAASNVMLAYVSPTSTFVAFAAIVVLGRLGLSAAHPAVHLAIMKVGSTSVGQSAGLTNLTRQLGGSFGIVALTLIAQWNDVSSNAPISEAGYHRAFIGSALLLGAAVVAVAVYSRAKDEA